MVELESKPESKPVSVELETRKRSRLRHWQSRAQDTFTPGSSVGMLAMVLEVVLYGFAVLLLVAAAILVVIGGAETVIQAATSKVNTLDAGFLLLERIMLVLIIAELAYTLRGVLQSHRIAPEPFLFIGLIATVRRILIVTAAFEQPQTDQQLNRLLFELGALGLMVPAIAVAIFLTRHSVRQVLSPSDPER